jgi:regulator of protease activity HflC (stomatin/prohibitin superfamily)
MNLPIVVAIISTIIMILRGSIHTIEEGHVGVYWRGGALLSTITKPGYHLKVPFLDTVQEVQVTIQTDKVTDIPCGTSGGVLLWIERVEVVNRLREEFVYETIKNYTVNYDKVWIFDKIHHEINQFCSKHTLQEVYIDLFHTVDDRLQQALQVSLDRFAPGIEIISIRITKPKIPPNILLNYEQMEAEKTKLLVAIQAQKVVEKEAETQLKKAQIEAQTKAEVSKIKMEMEIMEKESQKKIKELEDAIYAHHEKTISDALFYQKQREAESNKLIYQSYTPEYLQLELIRSIQNNTKIYFGPNLQSIFTRYIH